MVEGCGNNMAKVIVVISNFVVGTFGALIFGTCLYANLSNDFRGHLQNLLNTKASAEMGAIDNYTSIIWALCVFGAFLFAIGFLGCCGASCDSRCLLSLYFVAILACAFVEIALAVVIFSKQAALEAEVKNIITAAFGDKANSTMYLSLAQMEKDFKCCGIDSKVPTRKGSDGKECPLNIPGCVDATWKIIDSGLWAVAVVAILAVIVQAFALSFTCCLYSAIGKRAGYMEYA